MLEHRLGDLANLGAVWAEFDAAQLVGVAEQFALTAAAGVNLRLEDDAAAGRELVEGLFGLFRRSNDDVFRDVGPGRGQQFFRLVFVDLHAEPLMLVECPLYMRNHERRKVRIPCLSTCGLA